MRFLIVVFESPTAPTVGLFIFEAESMRTAHDAARGALVGAGKLPPIVAATPRKQSFHNKNPSLPASARMALTSRHSPAVALDYRHCGRISRQAPRWNRGPSKADRRATIRSIPDFPLLRVGTPREPSRAASRRSRPLERPLFSAINRAPGTSVSPMGIWPSIGTVRYDPAAEECWHREANCHFFKGGSAPSTPGAPGAQGITGISEHGEHKRLAPTR